MKIMTGLEALETFGKLYVLMGALEEMGRHMRRAAAYPVMEGDLSRWDDDGGFCSRAE